jgi:pyridinium-3,5-biscarboxylic acid mononucleotide synthase
MDISKIIEVLNNVRERRVDVEQALDSLRALPYDDIEVAKLDLHRSLRLGIPEVVFCQNKTANQVLSILEQLWKYHDRVLATRVSPEMAVTIQSQMPQASYDPISRLLSLARVELSPPAADAKYALVISGGTSDWPVAEEAAQTLGFLGHRVERAYDVGVAGIHRLLAQREFLWNAAVIISVAGMEGALTSVVGGLVACPVIGVPTSVGYGAHLGGIAALLSMLNSCAPGVAVVNIDNGFGAGIYAHTILQQIQECKAK